MSSDVARPKGLFFDWDGTLVDSFAFLEQAHNHVLDHFEMPAFPPMGFKTYFGQPREKIYSEIYGDRKEEAKRLFEEFVNENHRALIRPMPGALELLKIVKDIGVPAGIVSNKKGDYVRNEVLALGWQDFFISIVGAGEAGEDKPSAAPLLRGAEIAGISQEISALWMVGDTEMDMACAQNAGCKGIFIGEDEEAYNCISGFKPAKIVKNCHEFSEFLLQSKEN